MDFECSDFHSIVLLDHFNQDMINCFYRPRCIVSENLKKNSLLYYLLFGELAIRYMNCTYNNFLYQAIGIDFEKHVQDSDCFVEVLIDLFSRNEAVILTTDLYYSKGNTDFYNRLHHEHYTIVKGYEETSDRFIIIDEAADQRYTPDAKGVVYNERYIAADELKTLACHLNSAGDIDLRDTDGSEQDEMYFSYELAKKNNDDSLLDMGKIFEEYQNHLRHMLSILPEIVERFKIDIRAYGKMVGEKDPDKSFYPFPIEIVDYMLHYHALTSQYNLFGLIMRDSEQKAGIIKSFANAVKVGYKIKAMLMKCFYSGNGKGCERITNKYLDDLRAQEKMSYENLLNMLDDIDVKEFIYA